MQKDILTVVLLLFLVSMSAYFSASETAFSSLNITRIKSLAEKGNKKADLVLKLSAQYDKLLSSILIGNNIVNIAMASVGTVLFVRYFGNVGATISTVVITVVVLIFGEISPKSLAKDNPERFAFRSAPLLKFFVTVFTPLNFLFAQWKKLLSKIFKSKTPDSMTQDELLLLVGEAEQAGGINGDEGRLLRSAIEFTDREAEDILTHRVDLAAVQKDAGKDEIAKMFSETKYSRLLVYDESLDDIIGIINQKDFYTASGITEKSVQDIMMKPIFIPPWVKISDLLKLLQSKKSHLAVVSDEYGGTLGIVTMEDILEELVGEIWDEHDEAVETFVKTDDDTYRVQCSEELEKLCEFFNLTTDSDSNSISGWVMEKLDKIPVVGDNFVYKNLFVTVTKTDERRVLEIEVKVLPIPGKEETDK